MNAHEDLKAYLDGELTPERAGEIERAIEADPALREELEFMKLLGFEIRRMAAEPAVVGMGKAEGRVRGFRWPSFARDRRWQAASATMVLVVVLFGFSKMLDRREYDAVGFSSSASKEEAKAQVPAIEMPAEVRAGLDKGMAGGDPSMSLGENTRAGSLPPSAAIPQMVIQTADLSVTVPSAKQALAAARGIAQSLGGFVEGSSNYAQQGGLPVASLTMRIPSRHFETALAKIGELGDVTNESSNGQDVTEQVVDVEARIKTMRAEEEQYRLILSRTTKIGEILEVKSRLDQVRQEVESLQARSQYLRSQAAYSTISATFNEKQSIDKPEAPKDWADDSWTSAVRGLSAVGRWLGEWAIRLFVFAPIWLPIVVVAWWLTRRSVKR